jgi:Carboxypeptidase regulatory-like domain
MMQKSRSPATRAKLEGMHRLLLLAALILPLLAETPMTTLTIQVKSPGGKPVENASVIVKFVKGHSVVKLGKSTRKEWELRTNQEGTAKIPPIPQGQILIQVIAKDYQTFGKVFDIDEENKTVDIALNAPQPQYSAH